jgi:hypothetical protein
MSIITTAAACQEASVYVVLLLSYECAQAHGQVHPAATFERVLEMLFANYCVQAIK